LKNKLPTRILKNQKFRKKERKTEINKRKKERR
jgi:hypothetical protein